MKEKLASNSKSKNSAIKGKTNENTSYNYYYSFSTHFKSRHYRGVVELFSCMKLWILSFKKIIFKIISKLSFLMQSMIFKIPIMILILAFLGFCHIYFFELLYFKNYYNAIKNEYLNKLHDPIDQKIFELDTIEYQYNFDEVEELLFFNIYFKELIKMGLIDEKKINNSDIFDTINNETGSIYTGVNLINSKLGINNDYSISNEGFIESKTSLSEIAKIYFYLLPSITLDQNKRNLYLNQSFLIAYEYNESLNEIDKDNYFYFAYPKSNSIYNNGNNFNPGNIKTNPKIYISNKEKFILNNKNDNNDFDEENWFSKQDYLFRNNSDNINKSIISFEHLNYNYFGTINKTFITSLQCYFQNNNKKYIINLINFFHQNDYESKVLSYSIFLLNNNSHLFRPLITEKYSNNETYVISQYNITEISMGYLLNNYFHYGIKDNKNNYYEYGVSFDNFDLNKMSAPALYYNTILEYYPDLIFIAPIYMYGKLFLKSEYILNEITVKDLYLYEFYNDNVVQETCSNFNFELLIQVIKNFEIKCDNLDKINLYSNGKEDNNQEFNLPYCGCLPLNCLNTSIYSIDEQYKKKNFTLNNKLKIPNKCINYFGYYTINDNSTNNNNLIQKIINKFLSQEELSYINFKIVEFDTFPSLRYLLVISIDNVYISNILSKLIRKLTMTEIYILMLIVLLLICLLILSIIVIIFESKKLSSLIYNFNVKYEKYIYQLEEEGLNEYINNNISENNNNNNLLKPEKDPLLENITRTKSFIKNNPNFQNFNYDFSNIKNSNSLLNELYYMFCEYYKLDPQNVIKKEQEIRELSRKEIKTYVMKEKNELFELLVKLSSYESKINLNLEYNLYSNSSLIKYFNDSLKKGKIKNKNEEKSTRDVIYELLSTENVYDEGLITNFNFCYFSYLNIDEYKSCKNALFNKSYNPEKQIFNMRQKLKDDQRKSLIKLLLKNKNVLYNDLQKFYDLDDIKYNRIESCFNKFLLDVYYKYLKKIFESKK